MAMVWVMSIFTGGNCNCKQMYLVFTFVVMSFIAQLIWLWIKRYSSREQRKRENIFQFKNLHPYEQLGIVWLLEAAEDQRVFIERVFTQSGLLKILLMPNF
jgi:hypothetical protein